MDQSVTTDQSKVLSTINGLTLGYGGDGPEAYSRALWETDTNPTVGWRSGARHEIVLIADNVPHDINLNEGLPESQWVSNPFATFEEPGGTFGIAGTTWAPGTDLRIRDVASQLGTDGKPLESVEFFGSSTHYLPYWEYWAALSGGQALDGSSGELASTLTGIIETGATKALLGCPAGQVRIAEEACVVPPKPTSHPTVSQVICNLVVATASDTCTATVGDAATAGSTNPTGTVSFASSSGGVFSSGKTCSLTPTPLSSNVSSCSVQFLPPTTGSTLPAITATYSGDATHNSSAAQTHYGPASSLASLISLDEAGTITPGGTIEIPTKCGFPCEVESSLYTLPDLGSVASVSHGSGVEAEIAAAGSKHGKKKKKAKAVLIGSGKLKLAVPGKGKLIIKLSGKGKRALRHVGSKGVRLTVKFSVKTLNGTLVITKKEQVKLHAKKTKKKGAKKHH